MRPRRLAALALCLAAAGVCAGPAAAASLVPAGSFAKPIYLTSDPVDPNRLFVAEREGRVVVPGPGRPVLFADLTDLVLCCESERGLLSIALAPDFPASGRFYAAYTGTAEATVGGPEVVATPGDVHLDAFRHAGGTLVREPILAVGHSSEANHNGGQIQFGPDGYLYLSIGDGGGSGDPNELAQNLGVLLGKVLRIDPRPGQDPAYAIPPGNPFSGEPGKDEIWSYGLRNPWRFSFDRLSGDMAIADVGQGAREEVDLAPSPGPGQVGGIGANYGWSCREGLIAYGGAPESCNGVVGFTPPVFDYQHVTNEDGSRRCSITGGYVVRDPSVTDLFGRYLYGDYCEGEIHSIDLGAPDPAATDRAEPELEVPQFSLYSFGEDSCGRVYVLTGGGQIYRLAGEEPSDCPEPPPVPAPSALPATTAEPVSRPHEEGTRTRIWIRIGRHLGGRGLVTIVVRVVPCFRHRGDTVRLKRDGRVAAARRLRGRCVVRFRARIGRVARFRAMLALPRGTRPARSRTIVLRAARRAAHRSQARTIALAKPSP